MKRILLAALIGLISTPAWASADGPDCYAIKGVASHDVLNIRDKPSAKAKLLGQIPPTAKKVANATNVECPDAAVPGMPKECGGGWCRVTYQGVTGWVNCKFLEASSECE